MMNDKEYTERQYRENVKKAALIQMDAFKQATSNSKYVRSLIMEMKLLSALHLLHSYV